MNSLLLNGGAIVGKIDIASGSLDFVTSNATLSNTITGNGSVAKTGAGTLVLTGTNTYTGGTTISAGTVQIGNGGTTGSITGDVTNNATLAFNRSNDSYFYGIISGTGAVNQIGTGTTVLAGQNTYTGGTTISAGMLQIGDADGTDGSIVGNVRNNATLAFGNFGTTTFGGIISGTGNVYAYGGTTVLTGENSYTGGTTINGGTLQLGDGGTAGSITGNVTVGGTLAFNRSDAVTFGGAISGAGAVNQIGAGTTILTGDNSYTGGTTIAAGALQLGNGGTTGSIVGDVTNNATLAFNRSNALTFGGDLRHRRGQSDRHRHDDADRCEHLYKRDHGHRRHAGDRR